MSPESIGRNIILHFVRLMGTCARLNAGTTGLTDTNFRTTVSITSFSLSCRHRARNDVHTDCFYAAVFEREDPALRHLPLAVQQKQIIVTCNYEARRRGLYKLQLVREAKQKCPDVIVVLGMYKSKLHERHGMPSHSTKVKTLHDFEMHPKTIISF